MKNPTEQFKKVISHAKEYGFIFPSSEIYEGLSAVYDYGQNGVALKNNIRDYWWKAMVQINDNIVGLDAAIFMHPTTWKASGHVDAITRMLAMFDSVGALYNPRRLDQAVNNGLNSLPPAAN